MKEKLNLLFLSDINKFIGNEKFEYMVTEDKGIYIVRPLPPVFNEYSAILRSYLAYDYDNLSEVNQVLFKNHYNCFSLVEDNKYQKDVKIYKFKKNKS